jgi:hypothetical protein
MPIVDNELACAIEIAPLLAGLGATTMHEHLVAPLYLISRCAVIKLNRAAALLLFV